MLKLGFAGAGRQKTLKVVKICIESFIFTFLLLASINLDGRFLNPKFKDSILIINPREGQLQTFCKIDLQLLHILIIIIDR